MKRFLAVFAGGIGVGALLRRRRKTTAPVEPPTGSLADELRTKLAESRAAEAEAAVEPRSVETDLETRRREVHERARGSIDELG
jgi:hypothetical protein